MSFASFLMVPIPRQTPAIVTDTSSSSSSLSLLDCDFEMVNPAPAPRATRRIRYTPVWTYKKATEEPAYNPDDSFDHNAEIPVRRGGKRSKRSKLAAIAQEPTCNPDDSFDYRGEIPVRRGGQRSKAATKATQAPRKCLSSQPVWFCNPRLVAEPDLLALEERRWGSPLASSSSASSEQSYSYSPSSTSPSSSTASLIDPAPFGGMSDSLPSWASGPLPSLINNDPL